MPQPHIRIVKVGGSLLDWPLLKDRLAAWQDAQPPACNVLIAGGGDLTDAIRRAQAIHQFDDEAAHWMCVQALSVTARLLANLVRGSTIVTGLDELTLAGSGVSPLVIDPANWLQQDEPQAPGVSLPHDWTATTDSIAARLAIVTTASELVLLKSADPPRGASTPELAAAGFVDQHFPVAAAALPLARLVNLRGDYRQDVTLVR